MNIQYQRGHPTIVLYFNTQEVIFNDCSSIAFQTLGNVTI